MTNPVRVDVKFTQSVNRIEYFVDGLFKAEDHTPDRYDEDITLTSGPHTLVCRALFTDGTQADSAPVSFTVG